MKEVVQELEELKELENNLWIEIGANVEEKEPLLGEPLDFFGTNTGTDFDSVKNQMLQMNSDGR